MKLGRYENYSDSGIDWLGDIPVGWKLDRIKNIGSVNGRVGWKALKASEYVESGYFFLSTPNIKNVEIDFANVNYITAERYYESPEIMLKVGDILLVKDGSTLGIVNVVRFLPSGGTVNSSIGVVRTKSVNAVYGYYYLLSNYIQNIIQLKKEGMGVPHLFQKDINSFEILIPPINEQQKIADYLDKKTAQIDKKVELLEQKIAYYKELRKSIINETVCRGLDKNVALKDSGIEWIGKIPEHWEVKRGKDVFIERSQKGFPKEPLLAASQKYGVVRKEDLDTNSMTAQKDFENFKLVKVNDFVISLRSFEGGIEIAHVKGIISPVYTVFYTRDIIEPSYYRFLLKSDKFILFLRSVTTGIRDGKSVKYDEVKNMFFPILPCKEQLEISEFLVKKSNVIDGILDSIKKQIETLKELRKTLINDVVTGKLKVN